MPINLSSPSEIQNSQVSKMFPILAIVIISTVIIFLVRKQRKFQKTLRPPGPPGMPFIGNLHQLFDTSVTHIYLWKLSEKYGPLISMKLGKVPLLVVSSASFAKEVLKTQDLAFCNRPKVVGQDRLSYNGLDIAFAAYDEAWREIRKICIAHLFCNKQVVSFRPIREEEVSRVIRSLKAKASMGQVVNLSELMMYFTGTLICRIAFGKEYDEQGSERHRFDTLMIESQAMQGGLFVADYLPLFGWVDKLSGMMSRLDKVCKELDVFFEELIDERMVSKSRNPNLLDLLIQLKEEKSCQVHLTWDHVKAITMDVLIAGTDTGAATIVWVMTALMKNPEKIMKVQNEMREVMGNKDNITEDDIPKLTYLKAVIKETLRLFPPAPLLLPRETLKESIIGGYKIPAKTLVYINAWAIARDPEFWDNSDEFVPERFLNSDIDIIGQDFQVIPFGAGRRGCPGISMGLATVEIMLANLLYTFNFELPIGMKKEDIDLNVLPGLTMHKKNALCLCLKTIN